MGTHFLDHLFSPQAIAVIGASERHDSVGGCIFDNLRKSGFTGPVYAVNPKYKRLFHQPCYASITDIDDSVDLVVIAIPAPVIPEIIHECGEHGVRTAIIISTGFNREDAQSKSLKKTLLEIARNYQMRILGPNCLGLIRPKAGMNATFSKNTAKVGQMALVSQSGALCTSILDWASSHDIGFSAIVSMGDAIDISFGDILDYLALDPQTHSILLYIEGIRDARSFMSGLRIAARMKPVIVIKAGRHDEASRAVVTHSGAITGADDIFDAALQRAGVVRVMTIEQLFAAAQLLVTQYRVNGKRLAIITNGGGLGVMATDRAIDLDVSLASLTDNTLLQLDEVLPQHWSHDNPVDILGDATPKRYQDAVKACLNDPGVDGILVMLSPQALTDITGCAQAVVDARGNSDKPVLTCWMGNQLVNEANKLFTQYHIPNFSSPESSVEAFAYLARYYQNQQLLLQVPGPLVTRNEPDVDGARLIIESVLAQKRTVLTITESKAVLHAFSIPVTQTLECQSANDALIAAESMDFPVAMKIKSPDITHKSDVGGIKLNISSAHTIRSSYHEIVDEVKKHRPDAIIEGVTVEPMYKSPYGRELLVGVTHDPIFGPAITFGAGGVEVEVTRDRAVSLPPLNTFLAKKMISQTHVQQLLGAFRNMPEINMDALVQLLRRVSEMVCELPEIKAMDINPLIADEKGVLALDARIEVANLQPSRDRYAHMAIHPYPTHLVSLLQLADGTNIKIRPIRPEDADIEQSFVRDLSPQSKHFRFMQAVNELTQLMLVRFTQLDYNRELALIAVLESPESEKELGVARYVMNPDGESCEFALVVADTWQHKGIGSHLMSALIDAARQSGIKIMDGEILANNLNMLQLVKNLGFSIHSSADDPGIRLASRRL